MRDKKKEPCKKQSPFNLKNLTTFKMLSNLNYF